MMIVKLRDHFPPRAVEWLVSGILISWGISVILQPDLFKLNHAFEGMLNFAPQQAWGLYGLSVGCIRATALFVNGAWYKTPQIRMISSFLSAFIWTQILLGLMGSSIPTTALAIFPWFIIADFYSCFRAAADASIVQKEHKEKELSGALKADEHHD